MNGVLIVRHGGAVGKLIHSPAPPFYRRGAAFARTMSHFFPGCTITGQRSSRAVVLAIDAQTARGSDQLLPAAAVGGGDLLQRPKRGHGRPVPEIALVREQR